MSTFLTGTSVIGYQLLSYGDRENLPSLLFSLKRAGSGYHGIFIIEAILDDSRYGVVRLFESSIWDEGLAIQGIPLYQDVTAARQYVARWKSAGIPWILSIF